VRFRSVALIVCVLALVPATQLLRPAAERAWFVWQLAVADPPAYLPSPVAQVARGKLADTWGADRGGGRPHEGIDIFAPRDTPVRSTTRGIVTRVGTNKLGGQVVSVLGPGLESHYYAHLERFATIKPGDIVQPGDVLGYVGRTGNARTTPFHLHYGIYHRGTAKNPYPRLRS
jgi:murein DD-endopeptidase MepM/ murein hydrolase activator NlpD